MSGRRRSRRFAAIALAVAASGCAPESGTTATAAVRDSAGIAIVESPAALEDRSLALLPDSPDVDIGAAYGAPEYQLFRVSSVALLADGRIVVANAGSRELRFYDGAGGFLTSVGRQGSGPGEYSFPILVASPWPDTIVVNDGFAGRLSFLATDGTFVRSVSRRFLQIAGMLADGRVVTTGNTTSAGPDSPEGIITNHVVVATAGPEPQDGDTLGSFAGPDLLLTNQGGRIAFTAVPFDAQPSAVALADRIFVLPGRGPDIVEYDASGTPRRILRVLRRPAPVTRAMFDDFVERQVSSAGDENAAAEVRRRYAKMPVRESEPAWLQLLAADDGELWAEHWRDDPEAPHVWTVFGADGVPRGSLALPARFRLMAVGHGLIAGTRPDALDIEHVVAWRLPR